MAAGVPVVSSRLGAEGLAVTHDRDILIADQATDWPRALESINQATIYVQLSEAARALVLSRYDWRAIGRSLVEIYQDWIPVNNPAP